MSKILVIEDSVDAFNIVKQALGSSSQIDWAPTCIDGMDALGKRTYDLVLVDVNLPDGSGYDLCRTLRSDYKLSRMPIIMVTSRTSTGDIILGFSSGADDFISKPFDRIELRARIDSRLRRREQQKRENDSVMVGELEIDRNMQKLSVAGPKGMLDLGLTPLEFRLFCALCKTIGHVFTRQDLQQYAWGENIHVYGRSVDTHISKLRKKLGSRADYIQSVQGVGYRLVAPVIRQHGLNLAPHKIDMLVH